MGEIRVPLKLSMTYLEEEHPKKLTLNGRWPFIRAANTLEVAGRSHGSVQPSSSNAIKEICNVVKSMERSSDKNAGDAIAAHKKGKGFSIDKKKVAEALSHGRWKELWRVVGCLTRENKKTKNDEGELWRRPVMMGKRCRGLSFEVNPYEDRGQLAAEAASGATRKGEGEEMEMDLNSCIEEDGESLFSLDLFSKGDEESTYSRGSD